MYQKSMDENILISGKVSSSMFNRLIPKLFWGEQVEVVY